MLETMQKGLSPTPALLALAVAVYSCFLMVEVVRRVRAADHEIALGWVLGGAVCVGTGFWAEHFLGLLALELPVPLGFDTQLILLTWMPLVLAMVPVLALLGRRIALRWRIVGAVFAAGAFIATHGMGIAALSMYPAVQWDAVELVAALGYGCVALALSSWALRRLLSDERTPGWAARLGVALLCGLLLRGFHHALIAAAEFPMLSVSLTLDQLSGDALAKLVAATTLVLCGVTQMATVLEHRLRSQQDRLAQTLRQVHSELESTGFRDALTRLPNRLGFERRLQERLQRPGDEPPSLAVAMVNLDGFKVINDSLGAAAGDALLRECASRLHALVRHDDVVARVAGDEFLMLCSGPLDAHSAELVARRAGEALSRPFIVDGHEVTLSCSVGLALSPEHGGDLSLIAAANAAMQAAKRAGGATHCFYEPGMGEDDTDSIDLQRDLRQAIAQGQLMLHYQPKRHARTGAVRGVEALLRWKHPLRGMVSPAEFIPVAERFGLIGTLGNWVIEEACRQIREWADHGLPLRVAINLSVHQLRQSDLEMRIRTALARHGVDPRMLVCEITESVAMENTTVSLRVFEQLAAIGVGVSIDDFGTGYSSLSYLRRLPATELKIDRSFIQDLDKSRDARAIVEAVVRLSHALDLKVVAEGVETPAQQEILQELGCDELQGFLFARPMPAADMLRLALGGRGQPQVAAPRSAAHALVFDLSGAVHG
ncbi:MAG: putative bifunctional diguanylate cyclase/phosphodiesterase [Pseudomonadota bacterium]